MRSSRTPTSTWTASTGSPSATPPGSSSKLLRVSQETGTWTALFKCQPESSFARHRHLGAGEYLMISGEMNVRGGVQAGGITAVAGDYGYEPNGIIHDSTEFPKETVFYFTNYGPIQFIDEQDNTVFVLDWKGLLDLEAATRASLQPA
jgi:anti-sigma factor ChrR (cupin superfamily)